MATMNILESKNNKNEVKLHFTCSSALLAALSTFKLPFNGLGEIFIVITKMGSLSASLSLLKLIELQAMYYMRINIFFILSTYTYKNHYERKMSPILATLSNLMGKRGKIAHAMCMGAAGCHLTISPSLSPFL